LAGESKRVLIVDDDDAIRMMVERVLRREEFEVDSARDGFEAIQKLAKNDYGTILLDLTMPRVDGIGVLQFLERHRPDLRDCVIVMSANVPGAADAARGGRVARVLEKPFDLDDLIAQVRRACTV
jgi:DNA-binding NtrC family response regulator